MNNEFIRGQRAKGNFYEDAWSNYDEANVNEVLEKFTNNKSSIRGHRSKMLLVPDSKEYYKGIKIIQWYWFKAINYISRFIYNKLI